MGDGTFGGDDSYSVSGGYFGRGEVVYIGGVAGLFFAEISISTGQGTGQTGAQQGNSGGAPGWMMHTSSSAMITSGAVNFEGLLRNGVGVVFRINADVTREVNGDSYYDPVRKQYTNTTKKITEIGGYWRGGGSFQMMHETDNNGNLINENYQVNVGSYGIGLQFNWDSVGLKDVRFGIDTGFGLSTLWGVTENFQLGIMYVQRPK